MTPTGIHAGAEGARAEPASRSTHAAKAKLLAWAEATDARTIKARSSTGVIAAGGSLAVLTGMALARVLAPRRIGNDSAFIPGPARSPLIGWPTLVRAGVWMFPHALSAWRTARRPTAPR
jgi:hypothetical protein